MLVKQLFDLAGRKAIVTGGSRGLGLQMAQALGEMGAEVLLTARKRDELEAAVSSLGASGIQASAICCDLRQAGTIKGFVDTALARLGQCDILVNNAGATWGAPAEDHPFEAWQKVMDLNLNAVFLVTQEVARQSMIPRRTGRILNVASIAGLRGNLPGTMHAIAYSTSKGGLINFTRALAGEWGPYGITVNALAPGVFPSRLSQGVLEEMKAHSATHAPLGRLGDDDDLKGATVLLCSNAGKHITGQVLAIDGGATAVG
jgi:gluconate 5-dehydrogenase